MTPEPQPALPDFVGWPTFPFEGDLRVKRLDPPVGEEPPRQGAGGENCAKCRADDSEYIWVDERWRVRALGRPSGLPVVVVLETRQHYDLGDLTNLLAAELGVLTVRLERAIRSVDGVARVHVNRWGDGSEHLHMFFLARPQGMLQLRGTFLSMWDDIVPPIPEAQWQENLAFIAAWLADYSGTAVAEPPPLRWAGLDTDGATPPGHKASEPAGDREAVPRRKGGAPTARGSAKVPGSGSVLATPNGAGTPEAAQGPDPQPPGPDPSSRAERRPQGH